MVKIEKTSAKIQNEVFSKIAFKRTRKLNLIIKLLGQVTVLDFFTFEVKKSKADNPKTVTTQ